MSQKLSNPDIQRIRQWLLEADYVRLKEFSARNKRVLSLLTALSYDADPVISGNAVRCTGWAAKIIAEKDSEYVRNYLLRLFWLVNDESGGVCPRAPELIREILHNCQGFTQFYPLLASLEDEEKEQKLYLEAGQFYCPYSSV